MPPLACFGSSCHAVFFCSYRNFQKQCLSARRFDTQRPSFLLPLLRFSVSSIRTDAAVSSCLARKPGFRHESPVSVTKSRFLLRQNRATVLSLNQLYFSGGKSWQKKPTRSSLLPEEVPASDGLQKLFQTLCRQVLCLHRNQGSVCRRQCVNRQHPRRSATSSELSPQYTTLFPPAEKIPRTKGWSRQQLADHAKVGRTSIRCWETGQKTISQKCFRLLAENLGPDFLSMLRM